VNRHSSITRFVQIRATEESLRQFRDPTQLLDWLHVRSGDPEAKNDVLLALLRAARPTDRNGDLAVELMLLALWPGLCVVRSRLRDHCHGGLLDADVIADLTVNIRSVRRDRVHRAAATLLRNLERDLRRRYVQDARWAHSAVELDVAAGSLTQSAPDDTLAILKTAYAALGRDGLLLVAVHIAGFSQKESAALLGLSHEAARKRCQRALARLPRLSDH
jgi:RNA polymerase sigma-70 factor (ECF subfamily)